MKAVKKKGWVDKRYNLSGAISLAIKLAWSQRPMSPQKESLSRLRQRAQDQRYSNNE